MFIQRCYKTYRLLRQILRDRPLNPSIPYTYATGWIRVSENTCSETV
jgi:hypothetical protein